MKVRRKADDLAVSGVSYTVMTLFALVCLLPFLYVLSYSVMPYEDYLKNPMNPIPKRITTDAYRQILVFPLVWSGYRMTVLVTAAGTSLNVFLLLISAYPLSRRDLKGRNAVLVMIAFTMFFNGGLIPNYYLIRSLKLYDTPFALILPGAISAFNLILMKNFVSAIPRDMEESAAIDGANEFTVLFRIIAPLSLPAVATFTLFHAVGHWNSYFSAIVYLTKRSMWPLMLVLRELVVEEGISAVYNTSSQFTEDTLATPFNLKMAMIVVAIVPILAVYPFVQRYFMKGLLVGSIKG
jgi:putative aldouronate transport system permease protein